MTRRYYSVEGEILGDSEAGDYMRDALGSVTGTCNPDTGAILNTYRYKPYGAELSSTSSKNHPKFRWVGTAGYRQTSIAHSASYVRARHYGQEVGKWTTVDPLWPAEKNYEYCVSDPINALDPSGFACFTEPPDSKCCCCPKDITAVKRKEHRGESVSLPPPFPRYEYMDIVGISFDMVPRWSARKTGSNPPKEMPPCTLKWEEHRTSEPYYQETQKSLQMWYWHNHCPQKRICGGSQCNILDIPHLATLRKAIETVRRRKKTIHSDVCMRITLSPSCSVKTCPAIVRYFKFALAIKYPYINAKQSIEMTFGPTSSSCKPRKYVDQ